jgi:hypothetical protein
VSGRPDDLDPEIADASGLFRDEDRPGLLPRPAPAPEPAGLGEGYDLVDQPEEGGSEADAPPIPVAPIRDSATPPRAPKARKAEDRKADPDAVVPWSRGKEWGADLFRVGLVLIGTLLLVGFLIERGSYGLAFLALLAGGAIALVAAYPLLITLEVPARMTPEQALKDYYGSLNHGRPHFRRMWLLLSRAGREPFGSESAFRQYWGERLASLSGGRRPSWNQLSFRVDRFHAPKSHGLEAIDARYEVAVVAGDGIPVRAFPSECSLVRGPDRQWYLDDGRLSD